MATHLFQCLGDVVKGIQDAIIVKGFVGIESVITATGTEYAIDKLSQRWLRRLG